MRILKKVFLKVNIEKIKYNFFVFDTETTCLEPQPKNFVFGVLYGFSFHKVIYSVEDFKTEFQKPMYRNKTIFAHNAEFDLLTIYGNIYKNLDNAAIFNGKFISCEKDNVTFADSMNIYPTSVKNIGKMIDLEKLDNFKISGEQLEKTNITEQDINYCKRDCEIVFKALLRIFENIGCIKLTLPSLSMINFRSNYLEKDLYFSKLVDEFFQSYYGGRTEAFFIGQVNGKVYDINSMYPYVMKTMKFPDIQGLKKEFNVTVKFLLYCLKHYEGLAKVQVKHKSSFFGYLPCKTKVNNFEKLVFPVGTFETTVNFNELRFAYESGIIEILKVHYVVYSNPVESPFKQFIEDNYQLRVKSTNDLDRLIYKLIMNSLYGKFGQKEKYKTTYYKNIPYDLIREHQDKNKFCEVKTFNKNRLDCYLITENPSQKNSYYAIPTYASYITSEARLLLLKNLLVNEKNSVLYCDTDSIFIGNPDGLFCGSVSDSLGDFKLECKTITQIRGLKNYTYQDENGKIFDVIKGISKNSRQSVDPLSGQTTFTTRKYYKTKQAIQQDKEAGQGYQIKKVLKNDYDKRLVLPSGHTLPLSLPLPVRVKGRAVRQTPGRIRDILRQYEPQNIRENIMYYLISGGKILSSDLKRHYKPGSPELRSKTLLFGSQKGCPMDLVYEHFDHSFGAENLPNFEFSDMVLDVINDYSSVWGMVETFEKNLHYERNYQD